MRKRLTFIIMAFLLCQGLEAQNKDGLNFFNLVMPDNSVVSYELTDGVDIQFQDSIMVVNDLSFYMEDGVKYFFSEEEIAAVGENSDENASYIAADKLYVKCKGKGNVVISDLLGRVVFSQPSCEECVVDLATLRGNTLYLIKVNSQTLKFIRR